MLLLPSAAAAFPLIRGIRQNQQAKSMEYGVWSIESKKSCFTTNLRISPHPNQL